MHIFRDWNYMTQPPLRLKTLSPYASLTWLSTFRLWVPTIFILILTYVYNHEQRATFTYFFCHAEFTNYHTRCHHYFVVINSRELTNGWKEWFHDITIVSISMKLCLITHFIIVMVLRNWTHCNYVHLHNSILERNSMTFLWFDSTRKLKH